MSRELLLAWGGDKDSRREVQLVTSLEELDSALDAIELSAMQDDCIYQVDLWLRHINIGDPALMQFLIGHPERSSLLWHEHGTTLIATQQHIAPCSDGLRCKRFGKNICVEPELTRVGPIVVRETLCLFVLTNRRPDVVNWIEAEQD